MEQILDLPVSSEERTLNHAGFWVRVGATLIDGILLGVVNVIISAIFMAGLGMVEAIVVYYILAIFGNILYFTLMESSANQATLGKMAVGIKVGKENGERLSFGHALGRHLGKIVSALILYIGFMMAGWDAKKQALHDKMAGTYVYFK